MKRIIASVFLTYYLVLLGISLFVFLNLIIIAARVYKLRLAEANFLSCFLWVIKCTVFTKSVVNVWF